jgi:hypothetical protein
MRVTQDLTVASHTRGLTYLVFKYYERKYRRQRIALKLVRRHVPIVPRRLHFVRH